MTKQRKSVKGHCWVCGHAKGNGKRSIEHSHHLLRRLGRKRRLRKNADAPGTDQ